MNEKLPGPTAVGRLLLWCGFVFFAGIVLFSLGASLTRMNNFEPVVGIALGMTLMLILGYRALNRPAWRPSFPVFLMIGAFGLRAAWVWITPTQPTSDFKMMYDSAVKAAAGDFSFAAMDYYIRWVYQLGYTLYQGGVVRLFGESLLPLKLANAVCETLTVWLVYRMTASMFGETSGRIAGLLYAIYLPNILMCSVLTNQHLSTLFFAAGCAAAVAPRRRSGIGGVIAAALCFALGSAFRPMGAFYVAVFLIFLGLHEAARKRKEGSGSFRKRLAVKGTAFVAAYFLAQQLIAYSLIASGVTELKLHAGREPYWKFMVGLNAESNGQWNAKDANHVLAFPLGPERDQVERDILLERLADPLEIAALMVKKWVLMWAGPDDSIYWSLGTVAHSSDWNIRLATVERAQYVVYAFFGSLAMLALLLRRHGGNGTGASGFVPAMYLPMLVLLAYAALHGLIEIQIRYRLDVMPFMIALAGFGCACAGHWFSTKRSSAIGSKAGNPPSVSV